MYNGAEKIEEQCALILIDADGVVYRRQFLDRIIQYQSETRNLNFCNLSVAMCLLKWGRIKPTD